MNSLAFLNRTRFRIYFYRYKPFGVPLVVIFICVILFISVIIPQIQQWIAMQKEIAISEERINVLTKNLTFANKINNTAADKYLRLVTKALPVNKDFVNILAAINDAAIDASVPLNDYVFLVGSLSDETKNIRNTLPVTITITGGLPEVKRFIASLKNQLPLSEITDIQITSTVSTLTIAFYYKPFPEKVSFQPTRPLQNLTQKERFLIESLISIDISSRRSALSIQEQLVEQ